MLKYRVDNRKLIYYYTYVKFVSQATLIYALVRKVRRIFRTPCLQQMHFTMELHLAINCTIIVSIFFSASTLTFVHITIH